MKALLLNNECIDVGKCWFDSAAQQSHHFHPSSASHGVSFILRQVAFHGYKMAANNYQRSILALITQRVGIPYWWSISAFFNLVILCSPWKSDRVCHHAVCFLWAFDIAQTTGAGQTVSCEFSKVCKVFIWTHFQAEAPLNLSWEQHHHCHLPLPLFLILFHHLYLFLLLLLLQHKLLFGASQVLW